MASILGSLFNSQYSLGQLMNIDAGRQERSQSCNVRLVGTFHELKKESALEKFKAFFLNKGLLTSYYVIFKFEVTSGSGSKQIVIIRTNPDFDLNNWSNNKVKVYCSCPDFKFRSAYKLDKSNSLFLNDKTSGALAQSLSDAPKSKTKTSLLCKHAFAAVNWLVNNYANVMRTI